jgi:hypothetical protein
MAASKFNEWNHRTGFVDQDSMIDSTTGIQGNHIQAESCFLFVAPPGGEITSVEDLVGIGQATSFSLNVSKQVQPNFEIGSKKKYMIPGPTMVQGSLSKIVFSGPSLLKALKSVDVDGTYNEDPDSGLVGDEAGFGNSWYNLASAIFNRPIALGIIMVDSEYNGSGDTGNILGGIVLPNCYLTSQSLNIQAGMVTVSESVTFMCDEPRSLDI